MQYILGMSTSLSNIYIRDRLILPFMEKSIPTLKLQNSDHLRTIGTVNIEG